LIEYLTETPPQMNKLRLTNCSFKGAQATRMAFLVGLIMLIFAVLFILVRLSFFYISFWSLAMTFCAFLFVSFSAGRESVEHKMVEKMKSSLQRSGQSE
jgi:Ca2+/Na+ antiporter